MKTAMLSNVTARNCRTRNLTAIACGIALACSPVASAAVPNFQINVPHKTGAGQLQISKLKIIVSVENENPVTFEITDPQSVPHSFGPLQPASPAGLALFTYPTPAPPAAHPDLAIVRGPDSALPPGDPARKKYVIVINLDSDLNTGNFCQDTMTGDESWTIAVTAGPQITGVMVQSLDNNIQGAICGANLRSVPLTEPIATVIGLPPSMHGGRPGADVVLVLDRSGSMAGSVTGGAGDPKILHLRNAVTSFMTVWDTLRVNETSNSASPPIVSPQDRVGVVFFDHEVAWLKDVQPPLQPPSSIDGLKVFDGAVKSDILMNVPLVNPRGATSIGGGIKKAADAFSSFINDGNREVILLMTDGMQNTDPMAQVVGTQVQTTVGGAASNLANQPPLQIYTVTVGTGTAIDPTINQSLATATGAFTMNTETDAAVLPNYFLEVLQNFIHFSTVETLRMVSASARPPDPATNTGGQPYTTTLPVTTTTESITFNLTWNRGLGLLRLVLTPPGEKPITIAPGPDDVSGHLLFSHSLPISANHSSGGTWQVAVEAFQGQGEVPFNLMVLGDDLGIDSAMSIANADYAVGDKIRLRMKLNELEQPIKGLNSQAGAKVVAELVRPGASIGDLLSDPSLGSASGSPTPDPGSVVQSRLQALLQKNPNALAKKTDVVTLLDNGNSANGDDVAGDGIYSAVYTAPLEGHYNFLFAVEGDSQNAGRFSRQQLKTVHVRAVPDADKTLVQFSIQIGADTRKLAVSFVPQTIGGNKMGPGWAPYFWLTGPGSPPVPVQDQLDGSYKADFPFTGSHPPTVAIHFLRVAIRIPDGIAADKLPVPLDDSNVVIPDVLKHKVKHCCFSLGIGSQVFAVVGIAMVGFAACSPRKRRHP
jgi:hypothetical protein